MTDPVVVVAGATDGNAAETASVAEAAIEASERAFQAGVYAGQDAARVEADGMVSRAEFDALLRRVDELQGTAEGAAVVASVAAEVAMEAADAASDAAGAASEAAAEGGDQGEAEVKPPERREAAPEAEAKPKYDGYGAGGWFGKRS